MEHFKSPKFALSLAGIAAVTAIVIVALAQKPFQNPPQQFNVSGEGKVIIAPDIALVQVGVATQPKVSAADAVKENTFIMNRVMKVVTDAGITREDIKTMNYALNPQYEFPDGKQRLLGYVVSQDVQLKIRDLTKVGDIIGAATNAGANQVNDIQFTLENPEAARADARAKAIEAARRKASTIASAAGLRIGKLINFYEVELPGPIPYYDGKGGGGADLSVPVSQGMYEVVVSVNLVYEIK
ncbi:MAG: SIMPL domain-containing protein [Patescibacteria group bacterium]